MKNLQQNNIDGLEQVPRLKKIIYWIGFLVILFVFFSVITNTFSYFDPMNFCYISIDNDVLKGNQKGIQKAIKLLKKENKEEYKTLCKYVEKISEKNCLNCDWHIDRSCYEKDIPKGCYIKGSGVIYLLPDENESEDSIKSRAETIGKYALRSQEFWKKLK